MMGQNIENSLVYEEWEIMRFFQGLTIAYHLDHLTVDEYSEAIKSLIFMDERGTIWAIGPASGEWYFRDEDDWIMGEPNTLLTQIEKNEEYISDTKSDKPVLDLRNPIIKELLKKM